MIDINTGVGNRVGQYDVSDKDLVKAIRQSQANRVITPILCSQKGSPNGDDAQRYDFLKTYVFSPPGTKTEHL